MIHTERTDLAEGSDAAAEARALKLWIILARAFRAVEARAQGDAARHELTLAQFGILDALYHRGPMLIGELQERILVSSGGISYLVDSLEARGLVERQPSLEDRRARYAALTPEGAALFARAFPEHARAIRAAVAGLSGEEQRQATDLLRRLGLAAADVAQERDAGQDEGAAQDGRA